MAFLAKWFWGTLSSLGLYNKRARIVFLGLDDAGKTTLMHMLRDDKLIIHEPTGHPQKDEVQIGNIKFCTHDLGGHAAARRVWKDFYGVVDAIVFMVDSTKPERFPEAREELAKVMGSEALAGAKAKIPVLVLGNKIDLRGACPIAVLTDALGLNGMLTGKQVTKVAEGVRPMEIFMCSVVNRAGYTEGFKWLSEFLS
jgi:GTP-binding protein SAR1